MDFSSVYSEEQERFRWEVRNWLEENIPSHMREPIDSREFTKEQYLFWREKQKELAAKGWLYPTYPKEYGGGGLTGDHEIILQEEFELARAFRDRDRSTERLILSTILVWGTDEQKRKFLEPILRGEKTTWQKFTEPKGGADLADYQSRAVRDGDDWLLSGSNVFVSGRPRPDWESGPDYLWGPMVTDADAPRHRNLGFFMIPVPSEGLEVREQPLLDGHEQHAIFLDNVRVTSDHLIGGDKQGWQVTGTTLEQEHGGRGEAFGGDPVVDSLISHVLNFNHKIVMSGRSDIAKQLAMGSVIDGHRNALLAKRTYWMYQQRMDINYEGNVADVHQRESTLRIADTARAILGMFSLLGTKESMAPDLGINEPNQRIRAGQNHEGGSTNIAKVVLSRRIGISRTKERAAPTPSTAMKSVD